MLLQLATLSDRRPYERLELLRIRDTREVLNFVLLSQYDRLFLVVIFFGNLLPIPVILLTYLVLKFEVLRIILNFNFIYRE